MAANKQSKLRREWSRDSVNESNNDQVRSSQNSLNRQSQEQNQNEDMTQSSQHQGPMTNEMSTTHRAQSSDRIGYPQTDEPLRSQEFNRQVSSEGQGDPSMHSLAISPPVSPPVPTLDVVRPRTGPTVNRSITPMRGPQNGFTFQRQRSDSRRKPYSETIGRFRTKFSPIKMTPYGNGICYILTTSDDPIYGIDIDVRKLTDMYTNGFRFNVCGGDNDSEQGHYRCVGIDQLKEILQILNNQYNGRYIRGAEYDRIFFHIFSTGTRDVIKMADDSYKKKTEILKIFDENLPFLDKQVPVVLFIHSKCNDSLSLRQDGNPSTQSEIKTNSPNLTAHFSVSHRETGAARNGSWIIRELVDEMKQSHDSMPINAIVAKVSEKAERNSRIGFDTANTEFKELYLSMNDDFFSSD